MPTTIPRNRGAADLKYACCKNSRMMGSDNYVTTSRPVAPYYDGGEEDCVGKHVYTEMSYPQYLYDFQLEEHRQSAEEGEYYLVHDAPTFNLVETVGGAYLADVYFALRLSAHAGSEDGPFRRFTIDGHWDPTDVNNDVDKVLDHTRPSPGALCATRNECRYAYDICTVAPFSDEVGLFDSNFILIDSGNLSLYEEQARNDSRSVITYDPAGAEEELFYARGMYIDFDKVGQSFLPKKESLMDSSKYEMSFSEEPTSIDNDAIPEIVPNELYNGVGNVINFIYDADETPTLIVSFDIAYTNSNLFADSGLGFLTLIDCEFELGIKDLKFNKKVPESGDLYCVPGVVSIAIDGDTKYTCNTVTMKNNLKSQFGLMSSTESVRCSYVLDAPTDIEIYNLKSSEAMHRKAKINFESFSTPYPPQTQEPPTAHVIMILRLMPSETEILTFKKEDQDIIRACRKLVRLKSVYLYGQTFTNAVEKPIKLYEQKYYISTGKHGDFPPQGFDSTGSLLYVQPNDKSTIEQLDLLTGVVGMPNSAGVNQSMNKVRGRSMYECHPDKESVGTGRNLALWEARQKEIHDSIINFGATKFAAQSCQIPGLYDYLFVYKKGTALYLPQITSSFENSLPRPLLAVEQKASYTPCGHFFEHDYENLYFDAACGKRGSAFARIPADVFDYVFRHACGDDVSWTSMDVLVAYTRGIASVLINPFLFVASEISRRENAAMGARASAVGGRTTNLLPGPVRPVY